MFRLFRSTNAHFAVSDELLAVNGSSPHLEVSDRAIRVVVEGRGDMRVLRLVGELDLATRDLVTRMCTRRGPQDVVVDLSALTFLDCAGYRAFDSARTTLELRRRTLVLVGAVGGPRRLLDLVHHDTLQHPPQAELLPEPRVEAHVPLLPDSPTTNGRHCPLIGCSPS